MKYTQKDLSRLADVGRETLRYLEKKGLLIPEIDPQNGYHYYDAEQLKRVQEYKTLQSFGFSADQIYGILSQSTLEEYLQAMEEAQLSAKKDLFERMLRYDYLQDRIEKLQTIPEKAEKLYITQTPSYCFVKDTTFETDFVFEKETNPDILFMASQRAFTMISSYTPDIGKPNAYLGVSMRTDLVTQLGGDIANMIQIGDGESVYGILCKNSRGTSSNSRARIRACAEYAGRELIGPILYNKLLTVRDQDTEIMYSEIIAPLK